MFQFFEGTKDIPHDEFLKIQESERARKQLLASQGRRPEYAELPATFLGVSRTPETDA